MFYVDNQQEPEQGISDEEVIRSVASLIYC